MDLNRAPRRKSSLILILSALTLAVLAALTMMNLRFAQANPGGNDFLARWMGAHYWVTQGISPYDPQVSLASQEMIYGRPAQPEKGEDIAHFVYPLNSMLFFGPFGLLDYTLARAAWMTLLEVCLIAAAIVSLRLSGWRVGRIGPAGVILFALFWYPGLRTIILGQFAGVNALLILLALLLIREGHDLPAGILLALSTAKPQMSFLILPFALLWAFSARRYRLIWSALISLSVLGLVSLAALPSWPLQFLAQLREYPSYTGRIGSLAVETARMLPGGELPASILLHAALVGYLLFEWARAWGRDARHFVWAALLTLVFTNLVATRTATPHYVVLLPAFFLLFRMVAERRPGSAPWVTGLGLLVLLVGQWALFLVTLTGNEEHISLYYPAPLLALLCLWLMRGWMARPAVKAAGAALHLQEQAH